MTYRTVLYFQITQLTGVQYLRNSIAVCYVVEAGAFPYQRSFKCLMPAFYHQLWCPLGADGNRLLDDYSMKNRLLVVWCTCGDFNLIAGDEQTIIAMVEIQPGQTSLFYHKFGHRNFVDGFTDMYPYNVNGSGQFLSVDFDPEFSHCFYRRDYPLFRHKASFKFFQRGEILFLFQVLGSGNFSIHWPWQLRGSSYNPHRFFGPCPEACHPLLQS